MQENQISPSLRYIDHQNGELAISSLVFRISQQFWGFKIQHNDYE